MREDQVQKEGYKEGPSFSAVRSVKVSAPANQGAVQARRAEIVLCYDLI
jgi:hypothetical protein